MTSLIYSWGFPHTDLLVAMTTIGGVSGVNEGVSMANNSQASQQHGTQGNLLCQHSTKMPMGDELFSLFTQVRTSELFRADKPKTNFNL